jgi:four helix bundle protein
MATVQKFTDLIMWQKAHKYTLGVYRITESFPKSEQFGLSNQIRRAAVSICSNVVEGFDRGTSKEFKQFLMIARGSLTETQAQLILAHDLRYIDDVNFKKLANQSVEIHKLINGFMKHLQTRQLATR